MSDAVETVEVAPEPTPEVNPFALQPDHEFKAPEVAPPEVDRVDVYRVSGSGEATLIGTAEPGQPIVDVTPIPAMPGTPESDFRRCPCIGVMPGRACMRCSGTKWVKTCPKCKGEQFVSVHSRKGAHARTERCGFCMGLGQVAARLSEVRAAEDAAKAYVAPPPVPIVFKRSAKPGGMNAFAARAAAKATKTKRRTRGRA
jgi:hypothetical protein